MSSQPSQEEHAPFAKDSIGNNTPSKRPNQKGSAVWKEVKRLKTSGTDPRIPQLLLNGYTHVCTVALKETDDGLPGLKETDDGLPGICNHAFKLTKPSGGGVWITTRAEAHLVKYHPETDAAKNYQSRRSDSHDGKVNQQLAFVSDASQGKTPLAQSSMPKTFQLTKKQRQLSSQAHWYVYARMHISKAAFDDNYYKQMLIECGVEKDALLNRQQLAKWVHAEFEVFLIYARVVLDSKVAEARGNAFAQFLHDGGTLESHVKFQAMAMQFIGADWASNFVLCFGLVAFPDGRDFAVAEKSKTTFESRFPGLKFNGIFGSVISDRAAKGVGDHLDLQEIEVCLMHDGDKLGASAMGLLTRSKNTKVVNPFRKGEMIVENARKMSKSFTTTHSYEKFWNFANTALNNLVPKIKIQVDHNGTRVAASHNLLISCLRLSRGLKLWYGAKASELALQWTSTVEDWQVMAEAEAVLNITKVSTTLAQHEGLYTGAFAGLVKGTVMTALRAPTIAVIDLDQVTTAPKLPRISKNVREMTMIGKEVRLRALIEGERRFCGNKTDNLIHTAEAVMSDRELLATVLDLRTFGCAHLSEGQRTKAKELYETAYVNFALTVFNFEKEAREAWEAKAKAQAEAAQAEMSQKSGKAKAAESEQEQEKKPRLSSSEFGNSGWSSEEEDEPKDIGELPGEAPEVDLKEGYLAEARKSWRAWKKLYASMDWSAHFKDANLPEKPDIVFDLMPLDVGGFYNKIIASDPGRRIYGHIPAMASCSFAEIAGPEI